MKCSASSHQYFSSTQIVACEGLDVHLEISNNKFVKKFGFNVGSRRYLEKWNLKVESCENDIFGEP